MINTRAKEAIKLKCFDCAYDANGGGKRLISECERTSCPIWAHRPNGKMDKSVVWEYKGFDLENEKDVRGEWVSRQPTKEEQAKMDAQKEKGLALAGNKEV